MIDKIRSEGKAYGLPFILRIKDGSLKTASFLLNYKINGRDSTLRLCKISQKKEMTKSGICNSILQMQ